MMGKAQGYSIQEVSLKLKIPTHTLRFWEKEFEGILVPLRTKGGQRRYADEHVSIIRRIKRLRERGMTVAETHSQLLKKYGSKMEDLNSARIDFLAQRVAEVVRDEVYRFFEKAGKETAKL